MNRLNYAFAVYLTLCTAILAISNILAVKFTGIFFYKYMAWNLFLAFIPLACSTLMYLLRDKFFNIPIFTLFWVWLLFFPNAPYTVTDLLHIRNLKLYTQEIGYSTNIHEWIRLLNLALIALMGILLGSTSLYMIQEMLEKLLNKFLTAIIVLISVFSAGYGVYIGRFIRLNSYDMLQPIELSQNLIGNINLFSVTFSTLLAIFILFTYSIFYFTYNNSKH